MTESIEPAERVFHELLAAYRSAQLDALVAAYLPTGYAFEAEMAIAQAALSRARERLQAEVDEWEARWRAAAGAWVAPPDAEPAP